MASVSFHAISLFYSRRLAPAARPALLSKPAGLQRSLGTAAISSRDRNLGPWSRNLRGIRVESADKGALEPMVPPYNVLITGSTKGERVELAVQQLRQEFGEQHVWGTICDVREGKDVKALVAFASDKLNYIDIWINNAGSNAYSYRPLAETSDDVLMEIVTTNTLGLMICCREAINMMLNQPRGGHIFNIDGAGSDGRPTPRFAAYGATKRSVVHLTKSLQAELQMHEVKNVMVHSLSPGMVTTDLLMSGATTKQAKFFINILAEPPDVVAEYLVPCIRSIPNTRSVKPTYIRFLTGLKAYSQIFSVRFFFYSFFLHPLFLFGLILELYLCLHRTPSSNSGTYQEQGMLTDTISPFFLFLLSTLLPETCLWCQKKQIPH
ncbi:chlorophyll(ide) b reductase NOL, chloroplastic isoform X2 [Elaeis guineensis]|uniref:chlorophyll(ide) b reductase NOL, chloroplastic isoform X2 n=1 Tax=Elaeis guineensis var. tenera TaxID=51953 RepID=UPI003C6D3516